MIHFTDMRSAGLLPSFFSPKDPRPASEQLNDAYAHGGGFLPFKGFILGHDWQNVNYASIHYPLDPPMWEVSRATLREETLILFEGAWLAIVQPDGSNVICRVD